MLGTAKSVSFSRYLFSIVLNSQGGVQSTTLLSCPVVQDTHAKATAADGNDVAGARGGLPCVDHTLQLSVTNVLDTDEYKEIVDCVHRVTHHLAQFHVPYARGCS